MPGRGKDVGAELVRAGLARDCPRYSKGRYARLETPAGAVETFDLPNPPHIQQPFIQSIVDELNGAGRCPSTGETAARTSGVVDTVLNDYYGGRDDAFWDRPGTWRGHSRSGYGG